MFRIAIIRDNEHHGYAINPDGEYITFSSGANATSYIKDANARFKMQGVNTRYKIERVDGDPKWRDRESHRIATGVYSLPWFINRPFYRHSEYNGLHYAHCSTNDPTRIAYTPDEEYGKLDRKKVLSVYAYLMRFFTPELDEDQINIIAENHIERFAQFELEFATTADDIEWVYMHGPDSCMAKPAREYKSPFHPVRVYAGGDLAVAFIRKENGGGVRSRAVVWPKRKLFGRIFGHIRSMDNALHRYGYRPAREDGFNGARLACVPHGPGYVAPYVDQELSATPQKQEDGTEYLVLSNIGEESVHNTHGLTQTPYRCDGCGDPIQDPDEDAEEIHPHGARWCTECVNDAAHRCDVCDALWHDYQFEEVDGTVMCPDCRGNFTFTCDDCDQLHRQAYIVVLTPNLICEDCHQARLQTENARESEAEHA